MIDLSKMDKQSLAKVFDYSILPKDTTESAIRKGCAVTRQYQFAAFYSSSPFWSPIVKEELADYPAIEIGTGLAFPWGSQTPSTKAFETEEAVRLGCTAVDLVMNIGALKDKKFDVVRQELSLFVKAAGPAVTKCIIEVCFLTDEEIANACKLIAETGVQYAKTSSGAVRWSQPGAVHGDAPHVGRHRHQAQSGRRQVPAPAKCLHFPAGRRRPHRHPRRAGNDRFARTAARNRHDTQVRWLMAAYGMWPLLSGKLPLIQLNHPGRPARPGAHPTCLV